MIDYESSDYENLNEITDNLNISLSGLKQISNRIEINLLELHKRTLIRINRLRAENPYIVKSVIKYMAKGINKDDAMLLTAKDFHTDINRVEAIYWHQGRYMSAVNLFAKRYTCEKLKKNGFTAKQIGKIIGVSETHVFRLLKANVDLSFLEHPKNKKIIQRKGAFAPFPT